jgi:hypothetical protein
VSELCHGQVRKYPRDIEATACGAHAHPESDRIDAWKMKWDYEPRRTRTFNPLIKSQMLCQLS